MANPILMTLSVAAVKESVKFLYSLATEALRSRRDKNGEKAPESAQCKVPEGFEEQGKIIVPQADRDRLEEKAAELQQLRLDLMDYRDDLVAVTQADTRLERLLIEARRLVEDVYGMPLTFKGEQRQKSDLETNVDIQAKHISSAEVVGIEGLAPGKHNVAIKSDRIENNSKVTGIKKNS